MANSTLTSASSDVDQQKLQEHIDQMLANHTPDSDKQDVIDSMQKIQADILAGRYTVPEAPKQDFSVSFVVGQNQLDPGVPPDWHVNFTWHW